MLLTNRPLYDKDLAVAASSNVFFWPPYWRKVIARITRVDNPDCPGVYWLVHARNPAFLSHEHSMTRKEHHDDFLPSFIVGEAMVFDTVEELDAWARVAARID